MKDLKKYIPLIIFSILAIPVIAGATLWQYYLDQGVNLPSFAIRADIAQGLGIEDYRGTEEQNELLEALLREESLSLGANTPIAGSTYNLAGSGVTGSATSITLQSFTIVQTGQAIVDGDLPDTFFITIDPGNKRRQEIISCTTVVQNSGGDATLSGCSRGLSPITPYTASSTLEFAHAGGAQVIFSDPPQLFVRYGDKSDTETITGTWGFTSVPTTTDDCTVSTEFCPKSYIDSQVNQGAVTSTREIGGISEVATAKEVASTTAVGSDTVFFIPTDVATSSPSVTCDDSNDSTARGALCVPIAENDGFLNLNWWDLTGDNWVFASTTVETRFLVTGNATTTGSFVIEGDLDITGNASTTGLFTLGGTNSYFESSSTTIDTILEGKPTTSPQFAYSFFSSLLDNVVYYRYDSGMNTSDSGGTATLLWDSFTLLVDADNDISSATDATIDTTKDFTFITNLSFEDTAYNFNSSWGIGSATIDDAGKSTADHASFIMYGAGILEASVANGTTQSTSTSITVTLTNNNDYKIERIDSQINFWVNGVLEKTLTSNLPDATSESIRFRVEQKTASGNMTMTVGLSGRWPFDYIQNIQ